MWYVAALLFGLVLGFLFKRKWVFNMCMPKKEKSEPVRKCNIFRQKITLADIYRYRIVEIIIINPLKTNNYFVKLEQIFEDGSRRHIINDLSAHFVINGNITDLLENAKIKVTWELSSQVIHSEPVLESVEDYPLIDIEYCQLGEFSLSYHETEPYQVSGSINWNYVNIPSYYYHLNEKGQLVICMDKNKGLINYFKDQLSGLIEPEGDDLFVFPTMTACKAYDTITDLVSNTVITTSFQRKLPKGTETSELAEVTE